MLFSSKKDATIALNHMDIATVDVGNGLEVHYVDVLTAVIKHMFMQRYDDEEGVGDDLDSAFLESPQAANNIVNSFPDVSKRMAMGTVSNFAEHFAAIKMQSAFRANKARQKWAVAKKI